MTKLTEFVTFRNAAKLTMFVLFLISLQLSIGKSLLGRPIADISPWILFTIVMTLFATGIVLECTKVEKQ